MTDRIPDWLAMPLGVLSALAALTGCGLVFWAAAFGQWLPAISAGGAFAAAGVLWWAADLASANRCHG